jgi:Pyruvate/2-oxoacid:ferredoxin oxidoreductase delta subunit
MAPRQDGSAQRGGTASGGGRGGGRGRGDGRGQGGGRGGRGRGAGRGMGRASEPVPAVEPPPQPAETSSGTVPQPLRPENAAPYLEPATASTGGVVQDDTSAPPSRPALPGGLTALPVAAPQISIDTQHCTVCGECVRACPNDALSMTRREVLVDASRCRGCGLCVQACPVGAVALTT